MVSRRRRFSMSEDSENEGLDLTPMLDVVFIMLIFFIVTTSFVQESGIEIERPSAQTAERQQKGNVLVAVSEAGEIWLDGAQIDLRAVGALVQLRLAEVPGATVVVQSDRAAPVGRLVEVMDQIRLVGITNIAIATQGPRP